MNIAAIMPCRGRAEQTIQNVRRLLATAGAPFQLICMIDHDVAVMGALANAELPIWRMDAAGRGYWPALQQAADYWPFEFTHLINLANDLWACDDWLKLAAEEYQHHFGDGDGLLGFGGDGHGWSQSCHFLISRGLLDRYGGWPVWYQHNFGDTELCQRARNDGCYWKSAHAWLEHCHPERGLAEDDAIYAAGRATYEQDAIVFSKRRAAGWPVVSP